MVNTLRFGGISSVLLLPLPLLFDVVVVVASAALLSLTILSLILFYNTLARTSHIICIINVCTVRSDAHIYK